jgi:1A family penicillin-binding protein
MLQKNFKEPLKRYASSPRKKQNPLRRFFFDLFLLVVGLCILFLASIAIWISSLNLPTFDDFESRKVSNSTKIYDRTGKILLYNVHDNIKRTVVPYEEISPYIKKAVVSIEDKDFYSHNGIKVSSIMRGVLKTASGTPQGGSTITQQVIKNTLLTNEKTITRKIKEWILALKLENKLSKDEILSIYLNEMPFGGSIYGVEEASLSYFGKKSKDVTLAEAAYIASMPQAPSRYSPYGSRKDLLENRKNLVLDKMYETGAITKQEKDNAQKEIVVFQPQANFNGKAFHFSLGIKQYLEDTYGSDVVENSGLKVITTLDWELQQKAEEVVKKYALQNKITYNAENAALVAIEPRTGQVLALVGSRDYFDKDIDGKVNITTSERQPGSSFKPLVYATAFEKGYTPETVLFDVPTEFNVNCPLIPTDNSPSSCYSPVNYDGKYRGPITLRESLAQSLNVPAVKLLYLTGMNNVLEKADLMGITTLKDKNRYGLTLVLGGGEVTLLELTSAYTTFANKGNHSEKTMILSVVDRNGSVLEEYKNKEKRVFEENVVKNISSVLSDNNARIPAFGAQSPLFFGERPVAVKTGTTNDYRDVWTVGYTPSIVVGVWGGNNNNKPIEKKSAGAVISPMWRAFMDEYFKLYPTIEYFESASKNNPNDNPILNGVWCGLGSPFYSILYYINKENPLVFNPGQTNDSQFSHWQAAIDAYSHNLSCPFTDLSLSENSPFSDIDKENEYLLQTSENNSLEFLDKPISFSVSGLSHTSYSSDDIISISLKDFNKNIEKVEYTLQNQTFSKKAQEPFVFSPSDFGILKGNYTLYIRAFNQKNSSERAITISIQ